MQYDGGFGNTWSVDAGAISPWETFNEPQPRDDVRKRRSKIRELWPLMLLWTFMAVFTIIYSIYVYRTLLSNNPGHGSDGLPSASGTNLAISVLSQVFANMVEVLILAVFDILRWQLAARNSGISATTFFQLSSATQWIPMLFLTTTKISGGGLGLISRAAEFVYFFKSSEHQLPVFSGSGVPLDESLLAFIPASYVGIFFMSWIPTLLDVPKYAVSMPIDGCEDNCTSAFLPGSIETTRKIAPYLNQTLMEGGFFRNSDTIQIHNAPGVLLRYDTLPSSFDFDRTRECQLYGQHLNDTLQICIREVNGSLAVGWAACPTPIYSAGTCLTNTSWLTDPLPKKVLMTRYKQYATTAYNGFDFSILHVEPTSPPYHESLNASTYWAASAAVTVTTTTTLPTNDEAVTHALTYGVTRLLRMYDDMFPDDAHTPVAHLRNFLAIPHQFMVTCLQFANYTLTPTELAVASSLFGWDANRFAMPDDMRTVAVRGRSTTRLLALGWVVWAYVVSAATVMLAAGGLILAMLLRREGIPGSSGLVEVDLAARFQGTAGDTVATDGLTVIRELGRRKGLRTAVSSSFGVARELKRRKIRVVSVATSHDGEAGPSRGKLFEFREEEGLNPVLSEAWDKDGSP
ncbi:hypothetical protein C7999DRAFT_14351 [Corynascus novoguineensis]|uniref:Uncharacterized protein n=1 Tax=Corynascus novoguineensis TaxID=1126955 RepID=A0AAN7HQI4_9PEZI|nr:hypothetical protein C7999DRAFT_14351 [Corynascus novoguineensis]